MHEPPGHDRSLLQIVFVCMYVYIFIYICLLQFVEYFIYESWNTKSFFFLLICGLLYTPVHRYNMIWDRRLKFARNRARGQVPLAATLYA